MELRNCKGCHTIFNCFGDQQFCNNCLNMIDKKFNAVKNYIYDNPKSSIQQISDDMEVSVKQIKQWIREERLTFSDDSDIGLTCDSCGAIIKTGRLCMSCKNELKENFLKICPPPVQSRRRRNVNSPKMHSRT